MKAESDLNQKEEEQQLPYASNNPEAYAWLHSMHAVDNPFNMNTINSRFLSENNEEFRHLKAEHFQTNPPSAEKYKEVSSDNLHGKRSLTEKEIIDHVKSLPIKDGFTKLKDEFVFDLSIVDVWYNFFGNNAPFALDFGIEPTGTELIAMTDW